MRPATADLTRSALLKLSVWAVFIASAFMAQGCAAPNLDLSLQTALDCSEELSSPALPVVVGVDNFVDLRPQKRGDDNQKWMGLIPGMLWIEIDSEMPEIYSAFSTYNSRPFNVNLSAALAHALSQAKLFREVVFLPEDPYLRTDYRVEGVLRRSMVKETGYYYGSFMYVWILRILNFPYVSYQFELEADLRLRNLATDEIVWQGTISGSREDKFETVYSLARGENGKHLIAYNFTEIVAEKLPALMPQLKEAVAGDVGHPK